MNVIFVILAYVLEGFALGAVTIFLFRYIWDNFLFKHRLIFFRKTYTGFQPKLVKAKFDKQRGVFKAKGIEIPISISKEKGNPEGLKYDVLVGEKGEFWGFYNIPSSGTYQPLKLEEIGKTLKFTDVLTPIDKDLAYSRIQRELRRREGISRIFLQLMPYIVVIIVLVLAFWIGMNYQTLTSQLAELVGQVSKVAESLSKVATNATNATGGW
ncbi:hypothetical protein DRN63_02905 [Nanoarchaeota archaeon]|nr:MAG: hypothetical protein DRN63_02905 [Nanoarchaeota archaeon]